MGTIKKPSQEGLGKWGEWGVGRDGKMGESS